MNNYKVVISSRAKKDIKRALDYLNKVKFSPIAAQNVLRDFEETIEKLSYLADSYRIPESELLGKRGLRKVGFLNHDYLLIYKIEGNTVFVTNVFHAREDFENKL